MKQMLHAIKVIRMTLLDENEAGEKNDGTELDGLS